jgi:geranylgeranyl diphosphate synthase type I
MTTYALPPNANAAASATLTRAALLVAPALHAAVGRLNPSLQGPVHHHLAGGGKRVRAALSLLSASVVGAPEETGVVGAVAIELIHNFSLIHDDIIDGDTERRHRSTVWSEFGVGQAIIAGDALATLALQVMLEHPTTERVRAAACLLEATQVMIAGQGDDMAFETRPSVTVAECLDMERGKTSALLACAVSLGAILAGAPESSAPMSAPPFRRSTICSAFGESRPAPESRWAATWCSTRRRCPSRSHWPVPTRSGPSSCASSKVISRRRTWSGRGR